MTRNVTPGMLDMAMQKVCKWRSLLAGWQLGTRAKEDPESQAVRDQRELLILLRIEVSALTHIMVKELGIDEADFRAYMLEEAKALDEAYEKKFPGATSSLDGMHIDIQKAQPWMSKFPL